MSFPRPLLRHILGTVYLAAVVAGALSGGTTPLVAAAGIAALMLLRAAARGTLPARRQPGIARRITASQARSGSLLRVNGMARLTKPTL